MPQTKDIDWLNGYKTRPIYMLSSRDPLHFQGHIQIESEGWKKIFHANGNQKKAGVTILRTHKIDFKMKNILRDKEGLIT